MTYHLTDEDILALRSYADEFGKHWKQELLEDWMKARTRQDWGAIKDKRIPGRGNILHNLRNQLGPTWLDKLRLKRLMTGEEMSKAELAYYDACPAWQAMPADLKDKDRYTDVPYWSGKANPPEVGTMVICNVYNKGGNGAWVTGYFTQSGYLGVTADLVSPPKDFAERQDGDPRVHLFGAEID